MKLPGYELPQYAGLEAVRQQQLELLIAGRRNDALREATRVIEAGTPLADFIFGVLAPVGVAIGRAWESGEISPAQERVATEVAEILLSIAAGRVEAESTGLHLAVCLADSEHHNLPARMVAELLRAEGHSVTFLGAARPGPRVGHILSSLKPDALIISCTVAMNLPAAVGLAGLAHDVGIPVIGGGAGFGASDHRALGIGADAVALRVADVAALTAEHLGAPFTTGPDAERFTEWSQLRQSRRQNATEAAELMLWSSMPLIPRTLRTPSALIKDVGDCLDFVEAATLVDEQILIDYARWRESYHTALRHDPAYVTRLLTTIRDQLATVSTRASLAADAAASTLGLGRVAGRGPALTT